MATIYIVNRLIYHFRQLTLDSARLQFVITHHQRVNSCYVGQGYAVVWSQRRVQRTDVLAVRIVHGGEVNISNFTSPVDRPAALEPAFVFSAEPGHWPVFLVRSSAASWFLMCAHPSVDSLATVSRAAVTICWTSYRVSTGFPALRWKTPMAVDYFASMGSGECSLLAQRSWTALGASG